MLEKNTRDEFLIVWSKPECYPICTELTYGTDPTILFETNGGTVHS